MAGAGADAGAGDAPPVSAPAHVGIDPGASTKRIELGNGSWVDVTRGWLLGADEVFDHLLATVPWQASRLFRYDHWVEERRLGAMWRRGTPLPHPALADVHRRLQRTYKVEFAGFGMLQYRDGRDGQAFHRDTDMRWLDDTVIAILSLGATRPWLLRPRSARNLRSGADGATHDLHPASGDLIVMGGRCQADWEHSVPYLGHGLSVGTRVSLQWRHASKRGRPFAGGSYGAPLHYGRR